MEQIKKFLHGKGFALVLAACLLAAAAAGVWAVRTVRDELRQNLTDLTNPSSTARQTIPEPEANVVRRRIHADTTGASSFG